MPDDPKRSRVERELFVRAFLSTTPPARVAAQLSQSMRNSKLALGDVLYAQGEPATEVHFVVTGCIELSKPGAAPWTFGAGALVGMFDASIPRPHPRTAKAIQPTQVLTLDFEDYLEIIEDNFGFAVEALKFSAREQNLVAQRLGPDKAFSEAASGRPRRIAHEATADLDDAIGRLLVLRESALFKTASVQALASLARLSSVRRWEEGEELTSPQTQVQNLQIVAEGEVAVSHPEFGELGRFHAGGLVGGLESIGNSEHDYAAIAAAPTLTVELDIEDLLDVAEDHFDMCRAMLSFIATERARVTEELSEQQFDIGRTTI